MFRERKLEVLTNERSGATENWEKKTRYGSIHHGQKKKHQDSMHEIQMKY